MWMDLESIIQSEVSQKKKYPCAPVFEESAILSTLPTLPFLGYLSCLTRCSIFQKAFIFQMLDSLSTPGLITILDDLNDFWVEQMDVVLSASQANGIFFHSTSGIWSRAISQTCP